jgi:acyl transferase domain-containing protein
MAAQFLSTVTMGGIAVKTPVHVVNPAFVFSGAGPQWWAMGQELFEREAAFARAAEQCDALFQRVAGWSILAEMSAPEDQSLVRSAHIAAPANFLLQASLVALWRDYGVEPAAAVGHSSGEIAAAYSAGALSLPDAVRISYRFGQLHAKRVRKGAMLAVRMNPTQACHLLVANGLYASVAAVNGPTSVTLAGEAGELTQVALRLSAERVFHRFLQVDVPYHSPYVEPMQAELRDCLADLRTQEPAIPLYSTVTGRLATRQPWNAEYWCGNVREPVRFEDAVGSMIADGHRHFLEVGAHPVLASAITECLAERGVEGTVLASLRRGEPERASLRATLGNLHAAEHESLPGSSPYPQTRRSRDTAAALLSWR